MPRPPRKIKITHQVTFIDKCDAINNHYGRKCVIGLLIWAFEKVCTTQIKHGSKESALHFFKTS